MTKAIVEKNKSLTLVYVFSITLFLLNTFFSHCYAGEIVAIVNKKNNVSSLTISDLQQLFKGKRKKWEDGESVILILPPFNSEAMKFLANNVFKRRSAHAVLKFYLKAVFQQKFAFPPTSSLDSVSEVSEILGSITLVDSNQVGSTDRVKIIRVSGL